MLLFSPRGPVVGQNYSSPLRFFHTLYKHTQDCGGGGTCPLKSGPYCTYWSPFRLISTARTSHADTSPTDRHPHDFRCPHLRFGPKLWQRTLLQLPATSQLSYSWPKRPSSPNPSRERIANRQQLSLNFLCRMKLPLIGQDHPNERRKSINNSMMVPSILYNIGWNSLREWRREATLEWWEK